MNVFDVAEDAARADRGELLIITNQPDTRPVVDGEPDCHVKREGVGHAGLVDDDQRRRSDPRRAVRESAVSQRPGQFGQECRCECRFVRRGRQRRQRTGRGR